MQILGKPSMYDIMQFKLTSIATQVYFYKGIVIVCELHTKMKFKKKIYKDKV